MPSQRQSASIRGFSLVEMLIALVFTGVLMAGMATVFKSSLTSFYTTGEKLSSIRRNRMSTDLLFEDLNNAGMSLVDITSALPFGPANPPFYIIPNVPIVYRGAREASDPVTTDELYMAFDQPLAFEGTLTSGGGSTNILGTQSGATAGDKVLSGGSMTDGTDNKYIIECADPVYAASVKADMSFHLKDNLSHQALRILTATPSGTSVTVTTSIEPSVATQVTGKGDPGLLHNERRTVDAGAVFILPQQMVRYRIMMLDLDPDITAKPNGIPCLVREQGVFDAAKTFVPDTSLTQIITENVAGFKVYLSANSGQSWAGSTVVTTGLANGWTAGVQAALDNQVAALDSKNFTNTSDPAWYRNIPVLVRIDVTTRTANKRLEFGTAADQAAFQLSYKSFTQSLVITPRHFGLPMN